MTLPSRTRLGASRQRSVSAILVITVIAVGLLALRHRDPPMWEETTFYAFSPGQVTILTPLVPLVSVKVLDLSLHGGVTKIGEEFVFQGSSNQAPALVAFDVSTSKLRSLGESWMSIPAVDLGQFWIATLDEASPDTVRSSATISLIDSMGKILVPPTAPPDGLWPISATPAGVIFQAPEGLLLWDPSSGKAPVILAGTVLIGATEQHALTCSYPCNTLSIVAFDGRVRARVSAPQAVGSIQVRSGVSTSGGRHVLARAWSPERTQIVDINTVSGTIDVIWESSGGEPVSGPFGSGDLDWISFVSEGALWVYQPGRAAPKKTTVQVPGELVDIVW